MRAFETKTLPGRASARARAERPNDSPATGIGTRRESNFIGLMQIEYRES